MPQMLVSFVISFGLLVVAMSVHEFAHGLAAYKLGDRTAQYAGRLTLNPLAHIDPFWTLLLPLVLFISTQGQFVFGAAKPVPVNYWSLKNPRRDMIIIGASGPLANYLFAAVMSVILHLLPQSVPVFIPYLCINLLVVNLVLGTFNLIPIPPLDGSRILSGLLPGDLAAQYDRLQPYAFMVLIAFLWLGIFDRILWPVVMALARFLGVG